MWYIIHLYAQAIISTINQPTCTDVSRRSRRRIALETCVHKETTITDRDDDNHHVVVVALIQFSHKFIFRLALALLHGVARVVVARVFVSYSSGAREMADAKPLRLLLMIVIYVPNTHHSVDWPIVWRVRIVSALVHAMSVPTTR